MSGFNNSVVGGQGTLVRESIHSPDYVPGVSGWTINRDGSAEFNGVTFRGTLHSENPATGQTIDIEAGRIIIDQATANGEIFGDTDGSLDITSSGAMLLQSVDILTIQSAAEVDITSDTGISGLLVAGNIVAGRINITPVANTPTRGTVSYTMPASVSTVVGYATAQSTSPGVQVLGVSVNTPTTTGADIWVTRTNTTVTTVFYLFIGLP